MPSSSIIIPVYNGAALTRQCLSALLDRPYCDGKPEIIVVDDASTDLTPRLLAGYGDAIKVIRHTTNQGFAVACNTGAAAASGDYLVFLNNDTLPQPGWLDALVQYAVTHPAAGAVGSKLLFPNDTIQHAGVVICQDHSPRHVYAGFPADHPAVNKSRRFPVVTGACMLCPRTFFLETNGFDTDFHNGYEDVDLCLRLGELGYEVHYCHESVLYHFESATRVVGGAELENNCNLYASRWAPRVVPDDVAYYLEDGLLSIVYSERYPVVLEVSPYLAGVMTAGDELTLERLLNYRSDQVSRLLMEVAAGGAGQPAATEGPRCPAYRAECAADTAAAKMGLARRVVLEDRLMRLIKYAWTRKQRPVPQRALHVPIPPEALRYRVHRTTTGDGIEGFLQVGQLCAQDLVGALAGAGYQLTEFKNILDFGVGCGRTLRWLTPLAPDSNFYGTDIDNDAITWCQANLRQAACTTNSPLPPLPYGNCQFDLVYAVSVLTHLNESYQFQWLAELRRIVRPRGIVIVTLHGDALFQQIPEPLRSQADTIGFVFVESDFWRGIFPDWYQNTFHSRSYVAKWYPAFFRILAHLPQGLASHQDIVLLQRE